MLIDRLIVWHTVAMMDDGLSRGSPRHQNR